MSEAAGVKVLVVDHMVYYRQSVVGMLATVPEIEVVGIASSWSEALDMVADRAPDVITLDLHLPDLDHKTMLKDLSSRYKGVRPVLLSADPVRIPPSSGFDPDAVVYKPVGVGSEECLADFVSDLLQQVLKDDTDE